MGGEWREAQLGDLVDFVSGGTPSKSRPEFWNGEIPWVSAKDMKRFFLDDSEDHVTAAGMNHGTRLAPKNSVLVLTRGMTLLNDVPICVARRPMTFNQDVKALRPKAAIVEGFIPYLLLGNKDRLLGLVDLAGHGTGRLNTDELRNLDVQLPPEAEQQGIARLLGALDDKIELNRRMSETLESMARALFGSWCVDEEPPRVQTGELIAEGVLEIGDGYRARNDELGAPGLPFIRAGDLQGAIQTQGAELLQQASVARAGGKVSRVGDVAFTSKGTIGRFARVSRHTPPCVYSPQVCYWRSLDASRLHPATLYAWMTSEDLASQIEAVSGQTDMALYVSLSDQRRMEIPLFSESQYAIGQQLDAFFSRQDQANAEAQVLGSIRDALLPKLIGGDLRLAAAGQVEEMA